MNTRLFAGSVTALLMMPVAATAQSIAGSDPHPDVHLYAAADFGIDPKGVTFTKDIAPILQRSCQNCHNPNGGAPMSLTTYQEVRPWARSIKLRTSIRDRMGAMPPFFIEKDLGILEFKNDPSLSDEELAVIQAWADNGAPQVLDALTQRLHQADHRRARSIHGPTESRSPENAFRQTSPS